MSSKIDVTVAAVIEREGRFLMVEELVSEDIVFNQPAGHLEPGESLLEAVVRETREETGYRLEPEYLIGIYSWLCLEAGRSFLRVCFSGSARAPANPVPLDDGIISAHWLSRAELLHATRTLRSPLVLHAIDDYLNEVRYPLDCVRHIPSRLEREPLRA